MNLSSKGLEAELNRALGADPQKSGSDSEPSLARLQANRRAERGLLRRGGAAE